jgi:signal transduction histidine kinase
MLRRPGEFLPFFDINLSLTVEFATALLCLVGAARQSYARLPGFLLGSALLLWSIGDTLFSLASPQGAPVPSLADGFYLAFYPLAYTAILMLVHVDSQQMTTASWMDGLLTAMGCATLVTVLGADRVLQPQPGSLAASVVTLAYPIGDLAVLSLAVGVLGAIPHRYLWRHLSWLLVLGGAALFTASDTVYLVRSAEGTYRQGILADAGWTVAMVMMSGCTWSRRSEQGLDYGPGQTRVLLPGSAVAIGFGVLLYGTRHTLSGVDLVLAAATLVVAAVRVRSVLRELDGLEAERTMRQQAEESARQLASQEAENRTLATRLAGLLDAAPVGIIEIDTAGCVRRWNRAAERIYGWSEEEVLGRPDPNPATPGRSGQTVTHQNRDGENLEVELALAELGGPDHPAGVLKVVSDVSERSALESQLRQSQKLQTVGRLAEGLAHELNTPIQFVGDNVRFLEEAMAAVARLQETATGIEADQTPSEAQLQRLRQVMDEIDLEFIAHEGRDAVGNTLEGLRRMAEIVRAMGAFGRPGQAFRQPADLNEAVRAILTTTGSQISPIADVTAEFGELPPFTCHPGDINQVLADVVSNAVGAMAAVDSPDRRGRLHIVTAEVLGQIVIEVSDTGCGIPEAVADRIFDPFFTTKPVGQGSGLGLHAARSLIATRYGGSITFTSRSGQGTTFRIVLPLSAPGQPQEVKGDG